MTKPAPGVRVKCVANRGYERRMKLGEEFTLVQITEAVKATDWFTWPEYWTVINSKGEWISAHHYRWEVIND